MPNRDIRYGSTSLPLGFAPAQDDLDRPVSPDKLPRTDGARVTAPYAGAKVIPVRGTLIKGPIPTIGSYTTLRAAIDALRTQLASGPQNLYFFDDRYYRNVYTGPVSVSYERLETIAHVEIQFLTGDPFQYGNDVLDTWSSPSGTRVVTTTGEAYNQPVFRFTVGGAGSQAFSYTLTNNTTGKSFTLAGTVTGGDIIVVDTRAKTVTIAGVDYMSLFSDEFIKLVAGANTLAITITTGTLTTLTTTWTPRWWG